MIRLCVGISSLTPAWKSMFEQLGILAEEIDFSYTISVKYSCLIINSILDQSSQNLVHRFANKEVGGVLFSKNAQSLFAKDRTSTTLKIDLPHSYANAVSSYYLGTGLIFSLDFDPDSEFSNSDYKRKRFPFKPGYHPDEITRSTDIDALRYTVEILLKELHYHRKLPFVSKWHSPTKIPFFAFRVDTDFGDQTSLQKLYELADNYQIPMTWFLHVKAHEEWLDYFHTFKNQEIALHGYEHGTSKSYEHIVNNIESGKQLLMDAGLNPSGFCVPYSIWNETLGDVLNSFDFNYSSEFTLGYDTLPFFPIHKNEQHSTLQIPIHPICTGSLNRKCASIKDMENYFREILNHKTECIQNVLFYHHPMQVGLEIWNSIFDEVNKLGLTKLTFSEISNFWVSRLNSRIEIHFDEESSTLTCESGNSNLLLNISVNSREYYLIEASRVNKPLNSFESIQSPILLRQSKKTLEDLTGNRLQLLKTSILDWKNRIKL